VHCLIGKLPCINKLGNILDQPEILSYIYSLLAIWASTGSAVLDVLWTLCSSFKQHICASPKGVGLDDEKMNRSLISITTSLASYRGAII